MGRIKQEIKLQAFKLFRSAYKKRLFSGFDQSTELRFLVAFLKMQPLFFIDVGANKGEFVYAAGKALSADKIWAFEPLPWFSQKLKALFPGVTIFKSALSDKNTQTTLYLPVNNGLPDDSLASVSKPQSGNFLTYEVTLETLDYVTAKHHLKEPAFLKIDVEGHEFEVLKGGANFIRQHVRVLLVEIEERHHTNKKLDAMIADIEKNGFVCYYLHPQKQQLLNFVDNPLVFQKKEDLNTPFYVNNFWFFAKQLAANDVVSKLNQTHF